MRCCVCGKDTDLFTELYDPEHILTDRDHVTVRLCEEHHKRLIRDIRAMLARMRWKCQEGDE